VNGLFSESMMPVNDAAPQVPFALNFPPVLAERSSVALPRLEVAVSWMVALFPFSLGAV
jgi:hypothetical protein